jgi:hypothetical protein
MIPQVEQEMTHAFIVAHYIQKQKYVNHSHKI